MTRQEHTSLTGWTFRLCRFVFKALNVRLVVVLLVLALGSIGIYYVLPQELQTSLSQVLFFLVVPLFVYLFVVVPFGVLAILAASIATLIARRKIRAAATRLGTASPSEIAKEIGIDSDDIVPILDRLIPAGAAIKDEKEGPSRTH